MGPFGGPAGTIPLVRCIPSGDRLVLAEDQSGS